MARSISYAPAQFVDPSAWLRAWLPELRGQGLRVATTLAMIAEFAPGPLTPSAKQVEKISGGMLPEHYRSRPGKSLPSARLDESPLPGKQQGPQGAYHRACHAWGRLALGSWVS